ncbi:hypothetical protein AB0J28_39350, partial [Streptosporangium canum]
TARDPGPWRPSTRGPLSPGGGRGPCRARRLATACAAGAFAVAADGDWESLPRRSDLDRLRPADAVSR